MVNWAQGMSQTYEKMISVTKQIEEKFGLGANDRKDGEETDGVTLHHCRTSSNKERTR